MITRIFQGLAWLIVGGLALEVYLAGAALFGAATFQPHRALGVGLAAAILLLLLVALATVTVNIARAVGQPVEASRWGEALRVTAETT